MNTRVLEEHGPVIEDEVDACELLPGLDEDTGESTEEDLVVAGAETVEIRRLAQLLLLLVGNADLIEFGLEFRMVGWEGDKTGESFGSIIVTFPLDEPSRGFWEEDHTNGKNKSPNELDGDGDLPCRVRVSVFGGVVDNCGD